MRKPTSYFNDTFNYKPGQYEKIFNTKKKSDNKKEQNKESKGAKKK